jgi:hypothetical protein
MRKEKHRKTESNQIEKSDKRTGKPDRNLEEGSQNCKNQIENDGGLALYRICARRVVRIVSYGACKASNMNGLT